MQNIDVVIKFLSYLGLEFDESTVYLSLLNKGPMTVLELSRATKISRTNVYRIIERLKDQGFVEENVESTRKLVHPVGMHKLELLVKEQESKSEFLRSIFPEIATIIPASNSISQLETKVLFYKGKEGLKQIYWNAMNATRECLSYTVQSLEDTIGEEPADSWKREFSARRLRLRELVGVGRVANIDKVDNRIDSRFISADILEINQQIIIYNDVLAYFSFVDDEAFGVEIYNKNTAKIQRQLFEIVWRLGVEI